jgi:hypothetical protein
MEVLKGRHSISEGPKRNDIFVAAPCGFGKSLCFVISVYALGGITVCYKSYLVCATLYLCPFLFLIK